MNLFIQYLFTSPLYYITTVIVVMFSICVHEYAHAWTAMRQGDSTSAWLGHLSLNPRIQMGWKSIAVLLVIGIAWGAVPYNPRNFRNAWSGALMALAGPLANLLLSVVFAALAVAAAHLIHATPNMAYRFFVQAGVCNALLFLFNMIPLPMLDGWKVLSLFIPEMGRMPSQQASNLSWLGLAVLFGTSAGNRLHIWSENLFGFFLSLGSTLTRG